MNRTKQAFLLACLTGVLLSATTAIAQSCSFQDAFDKTPLRANVGGFITDSGINHFKVGPGCVLTRASSEDLPRRVQAVLFVESDKTQTPAMVAGVERHMIRLQGLFRENFGRTFTLANPVVRVLKARQNSNWYINTPDGVHGNTQRWWRLGNIKNEVNERLKRKDFDDRVRIVNYPVGVSDGKVGGNFG